MKKVFSALVMGNIGISNSKTVAASLILLKKVSFESESSNYLPVFEDYIDNLGLDNSDFTKQVSNFFKVCIHLSDEDDEDDDIMQEEMGNLLENYKIQQAQASERLKELLEPFCNGEKISGYYNGYPVSTMPLHNSASENMIRAYTNKFTAAQTQYNILVEEYHRRIEDFLGDKVFEVRDYPYNSNAASYTEGRKVPINPNCEIVFARNGLEMYINIKELFPQWNNTGNNTIYVTEGLFYVNEPIKLGFASIWSLNLYTKTKKRSSYPFLKIVGDTINVFVLKNNDIIINITA